MDERDNSERSSATPTSVAALTMCAKPAASANWSAPGIWWGIHVPPLQGPHPLTWLIMSTGKSIVLMSGGIDSSVSAIAVRKEGYETSGLFVDYGQPAARSEWRALQDVAKHLDLDVKKVELGFRLASQSGEFFGRNALLVLTAAGITQSRPLTIALGIHALSEYYDTQPLFLRQMQRILDGYFAGSVALTAPFLACPKAEVIAFARDNGVPLDLTYSCEEQNAPPCLRCPSCEDRVDVDPR